MVAELAQPRAVLTEQSEDLLEAGSVGEPLPLPKPECEPPGCPSDFSTVLPGNNWKDDQDMAWTKAKHVSVKYRKRHYAKHIHIVNRNTAPPN